eukprot:730449-Hanusia_phi.AAC.1
MHTCDKRNYSQPWVGKNKSIDGRRLHHKPAHCDSCKQLNAQNTIDLHAHYIKQQRAVFIVTLRMNPFCTDILSSSESYIGEGHPKSSASYQLASEEQSECGNKTNK